MKENYLHQSVYFFGNRVSDEALKAGYVDYSTLAKSFDAVMNNDIINLPEYADYWVIESGSDITYYDADGNEVEPGEDYETEEYDEVYQWFIISPQGAEILEDCTNELVYYNEKLDIYLWGVKHWGAMWSGVMTDIKINPEAIKAYYEAETKKKENKQ